MKVYIIILFFSCTINTAKAQSVAINNTGASPDSSAVLDIQSSSKGVLLPRVHLLSLSDTITIPKPALSLLVFNTNFTLPRGSGYYVWNGNFWDVLMSSGNEYLKGKNRYTITVDNTEREFWVHVPYIYDSTRPTPVVFMLHGTGGDGEKLYDNSGWKELAEEENFIAVFPSSMRYRIFDLEEMLPKYIAKWNTTPDAAWVFQAGETGKDDIKFLRDIIRGLEQKFNVDTNRIYLNGFSNGGQMAAKCAVELSDKLAAVAENASSFFKDTIYIPRRKIPVLFQLGNRDYGPGGTGPTVPIAWLDTLLSTPNLPAQNGKHYRIARRHIENFGLDSNYTIGGDTSFVRYASYQSPVGDTLNVFRFVFVDGLMHLYPNGQNHWFDAPRAHWAWMREFRKP